MPRLALDFKRICDEYQVGERPYPNEEEYFKMLVQKIQTTGEITAKEGCRQMLVTQIDPHVFPPNYRRDMICTGATPRPEKLPGPYKKIYDWCKDQGFQCYIIEDFSFGSLQYNLFIRW